MCNFEIYHASIGPYVSGRSGRQGLAWKYEPNVTCESDRLLLVRSFSSWLSNFVYASFARLGWIAYFWAARQNGLILP
jgi:hypothetical protein